MRLAIAAVAAGSFAATGVNAQPKPVCKWYGLEFSQGAIFCAYPGTAITCAPDGTWQQIPTQTQCAPGSASAPTILVAPPPSSSQ
jgi:hypothetical protein